jgi:hypothetical protein
MLSVVAKQRVLKEGRMNKSRGNEHEGCNELPQDTVILSQELDN